MSSGRNSSNDFIKSTDKIVCVVVQFAAKRTKNRTNACPVCSPYFNRTDRQKPDCPLLPLTTSASTVILTTLSSMWTQPPTPAVLHAVSDVGAGGDQTETQKTVYISRVIHCTGTRFQLAIDLMLQMPP